MYYFAVASSIGRLAVAAVVVVVVLCVYVDSLLSLLLYACMRCVLCDSFPPVGLPNCCAHAVTACAQLSKPRLQCGVLHILLLLLLLVLLCELVLVLSLKLCVHVCVLPAKTPFSCCCC
jgi:hypothetical protein